MKTIYSVYYQAKQIYYGYLDYTCKNQFATMYPGCIIKKIGYKYFNIGVK